MGLPSFGDMLKGQFRAVRRGRGWNPIENYQLAKQAQAERERRSQARSASATPNNDHKGGFEKSEHGFIGDRPVTFALGWGTKKGHTLIADGQLSDEQFRQSQNHDHYGPGQGPHNNGTLRGKYTGPGA